MKPAQAGRDRMVQTNGMTKSFRLVVGSVILLSFVGLIIAAALGMVTLAAVTQPWFLTYVSLVMMATIPVLGRDAYETIREVRGGE